MNFYIGTDRLAHCHNHERCMISANALRRRKSDFRVNEWILDSGAFTEISTHGRYRTPVADYAAQCQRWKTCGNMVAAVSQDYMCEPAILRKTGLTVEDHQRLTIERYDELLSLTKGSPYIMPVIQGYWPEEYVSHIAQYGDRIKDGQWVGVGSVCKRNAKIEAIEHVLMAVKKARPDLLLHGFGVKTTALNSSIVWDCLHSADSMAWSRAARWEGRDRHSWEEAERFASKIGQGIRERIYQPVFF